jgi:hypothetical protein
LLRGDHARAPPGVAVRVGRREARGDDRHLALRLLQRRGIRQTADDVERPRFAGPAVRVARVEAERRPDVGVPARREIELRVHDADHRVRFRVELNRPADRARRSAEVPLPEGAAQNGDAIRARHTFLGEKRAAEHGVDAEDREESRRRTQARHIEGLAAPGEGVAQRLEGRHRSDGARLFLPVAECQRRHQVREAGGILLPQHDEPRRIPVGQLVQEHRFDHAEDRGVRADAEDEREDRDRGKRRLPRERAPRVANVADHVAHRCTAESVSDSRKYARMTSRRASCAQSSSV